MEIVQVNADHLNQPKNIHNLWRIFKNIKNTFLILKYRYIFKISLLAFKCLLIIFVYYFSS
jgi:hypothetical protein